jgi:hypothetical protein
MASEFAKLNSTITDADLDAAWQDRLEDAAALDAGGRHAAAIATRLYALEIYLKFRICRRLGLDHPPKKLEIHDLEALIVFSGLTRALETLPKSGDVFQNWTNILEYSKDLNDLRYLPASRRTQQHSDDFSHWLLDASTGVLPWLQNQK